ncbi:MAG: DUF1294 domain-containing protein [Clostridiales bacterium]|nr:DUF1294 domain-containing protein [Clostridiales bacterium]
MVWKIIGIGYLIVINLVGFFSMGLDKRKARRGKWRIPEARLFVQAAVGGSIGSLAGMYVFRHKTRHAKFVVGMPAILAAQVFLVVLIVKYVMTGVFWF